MTMEQMRALRGFVHLHSTADRLFEKCGLPTSIAERNAAGIPSRRVSWRGATMRLSDEDWRMNYGSVPGDKAWTARWANRESSRGDCVAGVAWLAFNARGRVGAIAVRKRPEGPGYLTTYHVPESLYEAHSVVGVKVGLSKPLPASPVTARYGPPDEIVSRPGTRALYRYWVITWSGRRPESLHAVDFEIGSVGESCGAYEISAAGNDFVDEKRDYLIREWERDYVLD
jgi:hypothetical protein